MSRAEFLSILGIGTAAIWAGIRQDAQDELVGKHIIWEDGIESKITKRLNDGVYMTEPIPNHLKQKGKPWILRMG